MVVIKCKIHENAISVKYLHHCLVTNYLVYQGEYYLRIDGVTMGSPVAPVQAHFWMEYFKNKTLITGPTNVETWRRYVDDVVCVLGKEKMYKTTWRT